MRVPMLYGVEVGRIMDMGVGTGVGVGMSHCRVEQS